MAWGSGIDSFINLLQGNWKSPEAADRLGVKEVRTSNYWWCGKGVWTMKEICQRNSAASGCISDVLGICKIGVAWVEG